MDPGNRYRNSTHTVQGSVEMQYKLLEIRFVQQSAGLLIQDLPGSQINITVG
jgi:hypothetical protein